MQKSSLQWEREGKKIGFVPTMGALHKGHISLIKRSTRETKNTVVSIFVNPKQFENRKDFKHYPKNTKNDLKFKYLGIQIVQDRYLLRDRSTARDVYELPQWFWMRVAMGLVLKETNKEERAIEFYNVLSSMDFVSSTPTLFNSGTLHSQMSSCYINITCLLYTSPSPRDS